MNKRWLRAGLPANRGEGPGGCVNSPGAWPTDKGVDVMSVPLSNTPEPTWRELSDHLTGPQCERLAELEAEQKPGCPATRAKLLNLARTWALLLADVPLPAGAIMADSWDDHPARRVVFGPKRIVDAHKAHCRATCVQTADGHTEQLLVFVDGADQVGLSARQARDLAEKLNEAADQLDGWATR